MLDLRRVLRGQFSVNRQLFFNVNILEIEGQEYHDVYLHLESEDFVPLKMKETFQETFELLRMVPNGKLRFFYSINGEQYVSES